MAKKQNSLDYNAEVKALKECPPKRLYLLSGEEDYLRDRYLEALKAVCIPEGESGFSYKRFDGPSLDAFELGKALDVMPFLSERTFVELRNVGHSLRETLPRPAVDRFAPYAHFAVQLR